MRRTQTCLCVLSLALCLIPSPIRADDNATANVGTLTSSATVGSLADPANLIFKGDCPFPDSDLRFVMVTDLQTQLAADPTATLQNYFDTLDRRLRAGFRHAGYFRPGVNIEPDPNSKKILVSLDLGTRYRCGDIKIEGAKTVPVDRLIKRLTQMPAQPFFNSKIDHNFVSVDMNQGPRQSIQPAWTSGDPAPFEDFSAATLSESVSIVMAGLGYFIPDLEVAVTPAGKNATLNVRIVDEGPKATIDHIDVRGLKRNQPKDVIDYLKAKPVDAMDLDRLLEMQQRLWDCGRFKKHLISIMRRSENPSNVLLLLDLQEVDHLPLINEPLTPIEQVVLRCRQWLLTIGDRKEDLALEFREDQSIVTIAFGGQRGIACRARFVDDSLKILGEDNDIALIMTDNFAGVYLPAANLKFTGSTAAAFITAFVSFGPKIEKDGKADFSFALGGFVTTTDQNSPSPVVSLPFMTMRLGPAAFLDQVHNDDFSYDLRDGILTVIGPELKARIDAPTGRPLSLESTRPGQYQARLFTEVGAVDREKQEFEAAVTTPNIHNSTEVYGSFLSFVAQAVCHASLLPDTTPDQRSRLSTVVSRILTRDALKPLDDISPSANDVFSMPEPMASNSSLGDWFYASGQMMLPLADELFARQSWAWTLLRQTGFALTGHSENLEAELGRLSVSPDTGPLANLTTAELLSYSSPPLSKYFANRGLKALSATAFDKDIQSMLAPNTGAAQIIAIITKNIQNLSDADIDTLKTSLPPAASKPLLVAIQELQAHKDSPVEASLPSAFAKAWNAGLSVPIEAELHRLANKPDTTQP